MLAVTKRRVFGCLAEPCSNESPIRGCAWGAAIKSSVVKHSVVIDGHKTSVSLEDIFWCDLKTIAHARQVTLSELIANIDQSRNQSNLSSAIRLFVLDYFRALGTKEDQAGHPAELSPR